jgi:Anticodon binding domain.
LGIPIRITVGKKASDNIVELKLRRDENSVELSYDEVVDKVRELIISNIRG